MAKRRREEVRQKSRTKQRQQLMIIGAVVVVGLIAIFAVVRYFGSQVSLPDDAGTAYADVEQGFTDEGFPRLGSANAPIIVEDFSSFGCPHCEDLHDDQMKNLADEAREGHVQVIFYPVISIGGEFAQDASRAALCAGQQGKFWEMSDILFYWRSRYSVNDFRLDAAAEELGLDNDTLQECYNDDAMDDIIQRSQGEFTSRGLNSTPRVFLNGQELPNAFSVGSEVANLIAAQGTGR